MKTFLYCLISFISGAIIWDIIIEIIFYKKKKRIEDLLKISKHIKI